MLVPAVDVIVTGQNSPVEESKVFKEPGMVEVADGKVTLHQEHVLEQRAAGVGPIGHALIQGAICHVLQKDHGLLHDGQNLLGPQVCLLKVTWNTERWHGVTGYIQYDIPAINFPTEMYWHVLEMSEQIFVL